MTGSAIRLLARAVLTGLLIGSLALSAVNLRALAQSPAGGAFVERGTAGIAAATERALAVHATPQAIAARLDILLTESQRNWMAIEAVEDLAVARGIPLPMELDTRRMEARQRDSAILTSARECARCAWDASTCDLSKVLLCNTPLTLSPLGDLAGVIRGGLDHLSGREVDEVDVILSAIGLTAVALAVATGGSSLAIKAGAGFAKLARKMNRLPDTLTAPLVRAFRQGVDWSGIARVRGIEDLVRLLRPDAIRPAVLIVNDAGRMVGNTSITSALHLMKYADDPADLSRMARAADALGPRMVGTVEVLGKARMMRLTMRVADEVWLAVSGMIGALAALLGLLDSLTGSFLLRILRRAARRKGAT